MRFKLLGDDQSPAGTHPISGERLASIHAMRGFAALGVMLCHLTYANQFVEARLPTLSALFSTGNYGVTTFFVVSGFVIPYAMISADYRLKNSGNFFLRRLVRLEPPYIFSVFLAFAIAYAAARTPSYRGAPFDPSVWTMVTQFVYIAPWFDEPWINGVAWTLAIEFQYYLIMLFAGPLLISEKRAANISFLALAAAAWWLAAGLLPFFQQLPSFGAGFAAFLLYRRRINFSIFALVVGLCALAAWRNSGSQVEPVYLVLSAAAIFLPIKRPVPLLAAVGTISYSLYLVHFPIGTRIMNLALRLESNWLLFAAVLVAVAVCISVATMLWYFIERPALAASRRIRKPADRKSLLLKTP